MRTKTWVIVSARQAKTLIVREDRHVSHPKYKKRFLVSKKFYVHVEDSSSFNEWDSITIVASRPFSKLKRWIPMEVAKTNPEKAIKEEK